MPEISVLMPVFNGERYLNEAIDSILAQTFSDFELIIVDDGSTDNTRNILDAYSDARIVRVQHERNIGIVAALNHGIELAQGRYIARMDADDISLPRRFEKQVAYLNRHLSVGVVGCEVKQINELGQISDYGSKQTQPDLMEWVLLFGPPLSHPAVMMRTNIVKRVGGYSMQHIDAEDYDLLARLIKYTKLANLSECLLLYRIHSGSISSTNKTNQNDSARRIQQILLAEYIDMESAEILVNTLRSDGYAYFQALYSAKLINTLFLKYNQNHQLSKSDQGILRDLAGHRIYRVISPFRYFPSGFIWFLRALFLAPSILWQRGFGKLLR